MKFLATFSLIYVHLLFWVTLTQCFGSQPKSSANIDIISTTSKSSGIVRARPRKLSSSVACSRSSLMTTVTFPRPFEGVLYAKGFPTECNVNGNGTRIIHFKSHVNKCGIRTIEEENVFEFQLYLYIQYDQGIQQAFDERIFVRCAPQEILLSGSMGRRSELPPPTSPNIKSLTGSENRIKIKTLDSHEFAEATVEQSIDCNMDILKGRIPFLKPIDSFVDIGEDVTVLVKIKNKDGIDSKIGRCYAHDGTHVMKHNLTDDDGCTLDPVIMPNFKEFLNQVTNSKILHSTFPAFKFPDRSNLHIQCTVVICNTTCPKFECVDPPQELLQPRLAPPGRHRRATWSTNNSIVKRLIRMDQTNGHNGHNPSADPVLSQIGVSSSVGVLDDSGEETSPIADIFDDEAMACFTAPSVLIVFTLLFTSLLATLTFAVCLAVKVKALNKRLHHFESQSLGVPGKCFHPQSYYRTNYLWSDPCSGKNFAYGRMIDLTLPK